MALNPFYSRPSVWDPLFSNPLLNPFDPWTLWNSEPASAFAKDAHAIANTKVDWKETEDAHIFVADLPGLKKEDVKVELEEKATLKISGERHKEEEKETDKWHRVERSSGRFERRFRLPEAIDAECISAKFENGVLEVKVPKVKKAKEREVKCVAIGGEEGATPANTQQNGGEK